MSAASASTRNLDGGFADPARDSARAFRAILNALARPGRIEEVSGVTPPAPLSPAAGALLLTLVDGTTPVHLAGAHDCAELRDWLVFHTGARFVGPAEAAFALGTIEALSPLDRFAIGTPEYPDRAATLIAEVPDLDAATVTLRGPGIETTQTLALPQADAFRANAARFPLGFDTFLTCGARLAGLPRSTRIEEIA